MIRPVGILATAGACLWRCVSAFDPDGLFPVDHAWAHPRHSVAGACFSAILAVFAWPALSVPAHGPDTAAVVVRSAPVSEGPAARLTFKGADPIITGSVAMLFKSGSFEGPNEAEKTNRARLTPDGVTVSASFDGIRTKLAAIRDGKIPAPDATAPLQVATIESALPTAPHWAPSIRSSRCRSRRRP